MSEVIKSDLRVSVAVTATGRSATPKLSRFYFFLLISFISFLNTLFEILPKTGLNLLKSKLENLKNLVKLDFES